ncbi:hypothetical protein ACFQ3K_14930 [Brucella gallinifaecis]|uniref:hypothetical protein n=1 Tax=Brucella gallinifaecis TaxID=215590 RepID=UPI00130D802E|nr:hypothetical protein [Brucella gallinifaecis]
MRKPEAFAPGFRNFFHLSGLPKPAMLPTPEKILLTTLKTVTTALCNFISTQLHIMPGLFQRSHHCLNSTFQASHQRLKYMIHKSLPIAYPLQSHVFTATMNDVLIFEGFFSKVNILLILSELTQ